jgi:hypothetical protein
VLIVSVLRRLRVACEDVLQDDDRAVEMRASLVRFADCRLQLTQPLAVRVALLLERRESRFEIGPVDHGVVVVGGVRFACSHQASRHVALWNIRSGAVEASVRPPGGVG